MVKAMSRRSESTKSAFRLQREQGLLALLSADPPAQVKGPSGMLYYGTSCLLTPAQWPRRSAIFVIESTW